MVVLYDVNIDLIMTLKMGTFGGFDLETIAKKDFAISLQEKMAIFVKASFRTYRSQCFKIRITM